jgi:SET domain-containing protein
MQLEFDDPEILVRMANTPPSKEAVSVGRKFATEIETGSAPKGEVRQINDRLGFGFFVAEDLAKGAFVGEYAGIVRTNNRHDGLNDYLYQYPVLDDIGRNYVIDAESKSNHARFINHSWTPNIQPLVAYLLGIYHVIFTAIRDIPYGTQLSYNYGESYWYLREPPEPLY